MTAAEALAQAVREALEAGLSDVEVCEHVAGAIHGVELTPDRLSPSTAARQRALAEIEALTAAEPGPEVWTLEEVRAAHAALDALLLRPKIPGAP